MYNFAPGFPNSFYMKEQNEKFEEWIKSGFGHVFSASALLDSTPRFTAYQLYSLMGAAWMAALSANKETK
jgi:hypothetical protein